jgi:hypothetical protein
MIVEGWPYGTLPSLASGPACVICTGPYRLPLPGAAQLRAEGIPSCFCTVNVHNQPS